jgi:hypothetical protein
LRRSARDAQALREQAARLADNVRMTQQEAARWRSNDLAAFLLEILTIRARRRRLLELPKS